MSDQAQDLDPTATFANRCSGNHDGLNSHVEIAVCNRCGTKYWRYRPITRIKVIHCPRCNNVKATTG